MSRMLVLSGGGAYGAYQAGALDYLVRQQRRDYSHLYGVSVGAINASYLAQYESGKLDIGVAELTKFWKQLKRKDVYKKCAVGMLAGIYRNHIYDSSPIIQWLTNDLDADRIAGSGRKLRVGAVCWDTGEYKIADETDARIAWWVAASSSYPNFFKPIKIDGQLWTDGGLRNVTPVLRAAEEAVECGIDQIDVIICENPATLEEWDPKGQVILPGFLFRSLSIIMKELAMGDMQAVGWKNELCELKKKYAHLHINVCHPTRPLHGTSLDFAPPNMLLNMRRGYEDAKSLTR
jgi:NTE family protein